MRVEFLAKRSRERGFGMEGRAVPEKLQWSTAGDGGPERAKVGTEPKRKPKPKPRRGEREVPVIYYLSRNGLLDHPHIVEITLSSGEELYLRDVINRLNSLRGKGIGSVYSWSCKRIYKNGFVWHDLAEDDFIYPAPGREYVLKGSEIVDINMMISPTSHVEIPIETPKFARDDIDPSFGNKKKAQHKVYKKEPAVGKPAKSVDSWQTRRIPAIQEEPTEVLKLEEEKHDLFRQDEVTSPPFSSSLETVEALIKAHSRIIPIRENDKDRCMGGYSCRSKPSTTAVLHQLSCGTISAKLGCGLSRGSSAKRRLPCLLSTSNVEGGEGLNRDDTAISAIEVQAKDCDKRTESKKRDDNEFGRFSYKCLARSYSSKTEK